MPEIVIPVAEYAPDRPNFVSGSSSNIRNVFPRTKQSYGPIATPVPQYNALPERARGAVSYRDSSGNVFTFVGTEKNLWNLKSGITSWDEVSRAHDAYTTPTDAQWQFTYFNGRVIATNFSQVPQEFVLATSTDFADMAGPPLARYIATVKNSFVVLGHTFDGTSGAKPQRVWWSSAGNAGATGWPDPGTTLAAQTQAGAVDILGDEGWVQGIASGLTNADAAVFLQYGVKTMMYAGPPVVWEFKPAQNGRGLLCPYSLISYGGQAYGLSQDGFFAFDGANFIPIGFERVDMTVLADLDTSYLDRMVGVADPVNRLLWWAYPGSGHSTGNPNRLLCYSIALDKWTISDVTCETIVRLLGIGYTLDELFTVLGYTLDTLPASLDSPLWTGGRLQLATFDVNHTLNFFTGTPMAATIDTEERQGSPGKRMLIRNTTPLIDGASVPVSVSIGRRERLQVDPVYTGPVAMNGLGHCPARTSGMFFRARMTIPSGATTWRDISGITLDTELQGSR